jgi:tRNA-dihydrouridine synthase 2
MNLETAVDIIKSLVRNISKPVSIKLRVGDGVENSIQYAQAVERAGAVAIAVHGRLAEQKHQGNVDYGKMKAIFESVKMWRIGNGGIASFADSTKLKAETGCQSVMICSAALKNPSVFNANPVSGFDAFSQMCKIGKKHGLSFQECKWNLQQVVQSEKSLSRSMGQQFSECKSWEECDNVVVRMS